MSDDRSTVGWGAALRLVGVVVSCLVATACGGVEEIQSRIVEVTAKSSTTTTDAVTGRGDTGAGLPPSTTHAGQDDVDPPPPKSMGVDMGSLYLDQLDEMHRLALDVGLMLLSAPIEAMDPVEGGLDLRVGHEESLWAADLNRLPFEQMPRILHVRDIPETDVTRIMAASPATAVGMFRSGGDVVAIGFLAEDGARFLSLGPGPDDPIVSKPTFLGDAAEWLHTHRFDPVPQLDACEPALRSDQPDTPLGALVGYFTDLGLFTRSDRNTQIDEINRNVERLLAGAPVFTDPVTGTAVSPSAQDLVIQLRAGVSPGDVVMRGAIPVAITIGEEPDPGGLVVFLGADSGWFLGALGLTPSQVGGEDGEILGTFYDFELELAPPDPGEDVLVYRRSVDGDFQCPAEDGEAPLLQIPYDDVAGSGRAWVDVDAGDYRDYADWVPPELPSED